MDRLELLYDRIQELRKTQEERGLDSEDQERLDFAVSQYGSQLEANSRQAETAASRVSVHAGAKAARAQWYHLRLSVLGQLAAFHKVMQKMAKSAYIDKQHGFTYVLEQSGAVDSERGHNPHAHIRFRSTLSCGRLLAKVKRTTGFDDPAIKLMPHDNVNALRQYMLGNKGSDPVKNAKCDQDKYWRIEEGLKKEYSL
jgi:hypothetical protein